MINPGKDSTCLERWQQSFFVHIGERPTNTSTSVCNLTRTIEQSLNAVGTASTSPVQNASSKKREYERSAANWPSLASTPPDCGVAHIVCIMRCGRMGGREVTVHVSETRASQYHTCSLAEKSKKALRTSHCAASSRKTWGTDFRT